MSWWKRFKAWRIANAVRNWLAIRQCISFYPLIILAMVVGMLIPLWPLWAGMVIGAFSAIIVIVPTSISEANRQTRVYKG